MVPLSPDACSICHVGILKTILVAPKVTNYKNSLAYPATHKFTPCQNKSKSLKLSCYVADALVFFTITGEYNLGQKHELRAQAGRPSF